MTGMTGAGIAFGVILLCGCAAVAEVYQNNIAPDNPAILYMKAETDDPVGRLARDVESGKVTLTAREGKLGYLPDVLERLGIRVDSQALVFSKTSFQAPLISPRNPRAIYFTDNAAVGYVPGGDGIELTGTDSRNGVNFYTLNVEDGKPRIGRRDVCLQCHQGPATAGVPGIFIGSVFPSPSGAPYLHDGAIVTDHRTKFEERWGGWYVNGTHGAMKHRGNAVAPDPAEPNKLETEGTQNQTNLYRTPVTLTDYLAPVSDLVALMTLEHQTQMTNLFTRLGWETRIAEQKADESAATQARIDGLVGDTVDYMLFIDEERLKEPIQGVSTFTKTFAARGPRDRKGRSLRDFDLKTRLFKYPLSWLIYSAQFDSLPASAKDRLLHRLYDALTGADPSAKYVAMGPSRGAILEILRETRTDLPPYWKAAKN